MYFTPFWASAGTMPQVSPGTSLIIIESTVTPQRRPSAVANENCRSSSSAAADAGQQVGVHGVHADVAVAHGLLELLLLLRRGDLVKVLVGHEDFQVPLEPCAGRVVLRLPDQFQRPHDVVRLFLGDVRLHVRVADVVVRVHEDVDHPLAHRLERDRLARQGLAAGNQGNRDFRFLLHLRHQRLDLLCASGELHAARRRFADLDRRLLRLAGVEQRHGKRLIELAFALDQRGFGPDRTYDGNACCRRRFDIGKGGCGQEEQA